MALMTWPLTSDGAGAVTYTANEWRTLLTNLFSEGILGAGSFEVTQRAAGANMTLDIAAGVAILTGDDAAGQGHYIVRDDAAATSAVTITTANPTNPRIDRVGIQLRDPSEGGAAGRDSFFDKVTGTAAASPTAPAAPDSFLTLALVTVPAGATSIVDANIDTASSTTIRPLARLFHEVVDTASIADSNVTAAKIADSNVTAAKIADSNVTAAKIADANVTEAKLATAVLSSSWSTLSASGSWSGTIRYKKIGNVVFLNMGTGLSWDGSNGVSTAASTIATLPSGFRPSAEVRIAGANDTNTSAQLFNITTGGVITKLGIGNTGAVYAGSGVFGV